VGEDVVGPSADDAERDRPQQDLLEALLATSSCLPATESDDPGGDDPGDQAQGIEVDGQRPDLEAADLRARDEQGHDHILAPSAPRGRSRSDIEERRDANPVSV
jgi:hypothetical protein